nr:uncharacterized protein LOC105862280 isoform X1 [Microcebus murinus]XP_012603940.1 uncharacterized protein LOC105862280 isoform X1 [Microcebus murinus]
MATAISKANGMSRTINTAETTPPRHPKANGMSRNNGLQRKKSPWRQWRASYLWFPPEGRRASLRRARLLWRPGLGRHLSFLARRLGEERPWDPRRTLQKKISSLVPKGSASAPRRKARVLPSFPHSRSLPLLSTVWPETRGGEPLLAWPFSSPAGVILPEEGFSRFPRTQLSQTFSIRVLLLFRVSLDTLSELARRSFSNFTGEETHPWTDCTGSRTLQSPRRHSFALLVDPRTKNCHFLLFWPMFVMHNLEFR